MTIRIKSARSAWISFFLFILLLVSADRLCGQQPAGNTGTITGQVTDQQTGEPLVGCSLILTGTMFGSATDTGGFYSFKQVPAGLYTMRVAYVGYTTKSITNIKVLADSVRTIHIQLSAETLTLAEEIVVSSDFLGPQKRRGETAYLIEGVPVEAFKLQPSVTTDPGRKVDHNTEEYSYIRENRFLSVVQSPVSTFGADVDGASYANARRFIMNNQLPPADAIRLEEVVNYFPYDYAPPTGSHPLAIHIEHGSCDWNPDHELVMIGLKGKTIQEDNRKPSNLVFLLDVSGSMDQPNKLPLLKTALRMLVGQLQDADQVSIVVYAGSSGVVLPPTKGADKKKMLDALEKLRAGGSTAGGEGIRLAYQLARDTYLPEGNNRVILATDGDFNVGISSTSELVRFIEGQKDQGIFLTVLGFGMGNYKDDRLQNLADKGNGTHAYIDNIMEAKKVLVNEITSTLFTIAKDVKIQVEFNPRKVQAYRLIGYENRHLETEDFKDDTKDAGEIGAGHTVTAIYEIIPVGKESPVQPDTLKYQTITANNSDEVLTVKIRYKHPTEDKSIEFSGSLTSSALPLDKTSENFRFATAVTGFGLLLRQSEYKAMSDWDRVIRMAKSSLGADPFGYRNEFIMVANRAKELAAQQPSR